jgi:prophage regulatory protein
MTEPFNFPTTGFVRLAQIVRPLGPLPMSKATWWSGVRDGRFPQPVKLSIRVTAWRAEEIRKHFKMDVA